jgi:hypothetical protein
VRLHELVEQLVQSALRFFVNLRGLRGLQLLLCLLQLVLRLDDVLLCGDQRLANRVTLRPEVNETSIQAGGWDAAEEALHRLHSACVV